MCMPVLHRPLRNTLISTVRCAPPVTLLEHLFRPSICVGFLKTDACIDHKLRLQPLAVLPRPASIAYEERPWKQFRSKSSCFKVNRLRHWLTIIWLFISIFIFIFPAVGQRESSETISEDHPGKRSYSIRSPFLCVQT